MGRSFWMYLDRVFYIDFIPKLLNTKTWIGGHKGVHASVSAIQHRFRPNETDFIKIMVDTFVCSKSSSMY